MKKNSLLMVLMALLFCNKTAFSQIKNNVENSYNLESIFINPPESAKPGVLWMWMGSNISKEGIAKDLEALKKEGFNRTTMFSLADITTPWSGVIGNSPTPEIISWTEPWWKLVRFAAEESKRLGMDFGMYNGETSDPLTSFDGKNWMLLFIDADKNSNTGWYGYDYLINKNINDKTTSLMKYNGRSKKWVEVSRLPYHYEGNKLEIAVPRNKLKLKENQFTVDFHWSDNPKDLNNQISLCIDGDSAPNRRFNYRCIWKK